MASHSDFDSAHDMLDLEIHSLRDFVELFPAQGLSKVLTGYLSSGISKFPLKEKESEPPDLSEGGVALEDGPLSQEDCLVLMTEGIIESKDSPLAHCLLADYYLFLEEYESAVETARKGLTLAAKESQKTDLSFQRIRDALSSTLATALIYYQSPKNHGEAKEIFSSILKRKPDFTPALIGVGLILEEEEEYAQAIDFLGKALAQDPSNGRIGAELAWCQALNGDYNTGLSRLQEFLEYPQMDSSKQRGRELKAQTLYRIGVCIWELDSSAVARKNRQGAYAQFLASVKTNPNFAPPYTKLGIFYEDYKNDRKRARQCFQKAFELSPSELVAAERLARSFADQGEWDIVEAIAQRVVDSGKVRPTPGSKTKKGVSWPYSALGVVQMNRQEYQKSVVSFLSALRISPDDYHSYVGLGESYHNSGRYNSAARTFKYAENPTDGVVMKDSGEKWFTKYMLANVNRELGEYDTAIKEYEEVLSMRPTEFGVSIALLQTFVDKAWRCIEIGFFGGAADSAKRAIEVAVDIAEYRSDAFNLWKAVGDAATVFTMVQERLDSAPLASIADLLRVGCDSENYDTHKELDGIGSEALNSLVSSKSDHLRTRLTSVIQASILAKKRAIISCANDIHAQAVAWYNLGWTEYRAHVCLEQDISSETKASKSVFLRASMRCFKRAIELEAGNTEFWNSLGVVTTTLNPKVAQHAFVRSLHLNERNVRAWTNLGALYLLENDIELAHQAFSRAQSTDPDYAHAWVGEGIVALLYGDTNEALSHFTHAFELSGSGSLLTKRQYSVSSFDYLVSSSAKANNITHLIQPLFALHQLVFLDPHAISYRHLAALYLERVGNYDGAISALSTICETTEAEYETSESASSLSRFAQAKADLARNYLAVHNYTSAVEEAEVALDLTSDEDSLKPVMTASALQKMRLSARLTAGLSQYYLNDMDASISFFRTALEESNSSPDIICLLAEVLWAKGGENERGVAKDQLFTCIENHPEHVGAVVLLGAMAVMDEDTETMDAIKDELSSLRTKDGLDEHLRARIEKVLDAVAALSGGEEDKEAEVKRSIMLAPWQSVGWTELADSADDAFPATMALKTATRSVPPNGELDAVDLAKAFAGTGTIGDAQRAVMLAPWAKEGWNALTGAIAQG
ncbi:TPR-like protein [Delitschia confertaspora ATCC 74209]|uniref:TPR-like protein n=1 Tax=Delitschia confertaspora ATCC 74209 TaxID=1513339 RepID=A0A9P4MQ48_9PLEO|nr:TPR-like protein [Delitschia confertaspora ATCC 74209]